MNDDLEPRIREIAQEHAARYLEEFGAPTSTDDRRMRESMLAGIAAVHEVLGLTGKERRSIVIPYLNCFMTTYFKAVYGDENIKDLGAVDMSPGMLN
jgi:hypothetical protein